MKMKVAGGVIYKRVEKKKSLFVDGKVNRKGLCCCRKEGIEVKV